MICILAVCAWSQIRPFIKITWIITVSFSFVFINLINSHIVIKVEWKMSMKIKLLRLMDEVIWMRATISETSPVKQDVDSDRLSHKLHRSLVIKAVIIGAIHYEPLVFQNYKPTNRAANFAFHSSGRFAKLTSNNWDNAWKIKIQTHFILIVSCTKSNIESKVSKWI